MKQMKKVLNVQMRSWGLVCLVISMMTVGSCSKDKDDDDNKVDNSASAAIAGTYKGTLSALQLDGTYAEFGALELTITPDGADKAVINTTIDLSAILPAVSLPVNCPVNISADGGVYTITGEITVSVPGMSIAVSISGTVQPGQVKTANLLINPSMDSNPLGQYKYEGSTSSSL
jgi:hypothetical protein